MQATTPTDDIVVVLFLLSLILAVLYTGLYLFRPWRSTAQGRALMVKTLGNVFLLGLGSATLALGRDFPLRDSFRLAGMSLFVVGYWLLLRSLWTSPGAEDYPPRSWFRRGR